MVRARVREHGHELTQEEEAGVHSLIAQKMTERGIEAGTEWGLPRVRESGRAAIGWDRGIRSQEVAA